ncbi:GMC family oxidoreductase N-terminal domain-containing protein [Rubrobacter xylanophilus]|uniref:GMC family oxidoreductase n=1 Tax=Rubrobacter xylanophilus TaxID=49319 RepID=UPI001179F449
MEEPVLDGKLSCDYLVLGGGTAGAVVAARLAEEADAEVVLVEAGPSDEGDWRILELWNWPNLLGTRFDYDYTIEPQERGNSLIRHSRGKVLGGCSSHNSAIAFRAPEHDLRIWERSGAAGWGPEGTRPYYERVFGRVHVETIPPDNTCTAAFVEAARQAGFPLLRFNEEELREGVGWLQINARAGIRQSSSVAYLHPLGRLSNLTVLTETRVLRILLDDGGEAVGAETSRGVIEARSEVIVCCGAFDSPKLLMLSGIGPREHLREVGVPCRVELPGVGEHLLDHPEGVVIWEASRPIPPISRQGWEAALFARIDPDSEVPDLMFHFGTSAFDMNTSQLGYPSAEHAFSLTPNVMRARSEGFLRLRSADPSAPPVIDFRYFTDPDGYDDWIMTEGVKLARAIVEQPALRPWVKRELAPGPNVRGDEQISEYARRSANTVYHPAGTCRMGAPDDPAAVVDPQLRVRGVGRLRVADASIFPTMIGTNPCITCMMIGEKCADLVLGADAGTLAPRELVR